MLKLHRSLTAAIAAVMAFSALGDETLLSPDGKMKLQFSLNASGAPQYELFLDNQEIIKPSKLGFEVKNQAPLTDGFELKNVSRSTFNEHGLLSGARKTLSKTTTTNFWPNWYSPPPVVP